MTMMKKDALGELCTMQDEMNRLFERSRKSLQTDVPEQEEWQPPADIYEDEREVIVQMEVPGVKEEEISLRLEDGRLIVEGERRLEHAEHRQNYHRIERVYGSFSRAFILPLNVDPEQIRAACEGGILKINLLKKEPPCVRAIEIGEGKG